MQIFCVMSIKLYAASHILSQIRFDRLNLLNREGQAELSYILSVYLYPLYNHYFLLPPVMASSSSSQAAEQCLCSICQDFFTDPATIPCGHNFCMECISKHWDSSMETRCPLCKKDFHLRPDLDINREFRDLIEQLKRVESPVPPGVIPCDACSKIKRGALKSCLHCEGSFCKTHLEPHNTVAKLKKHKLINPVANLDNYICPKHESPLELFCRDDQMCVCKSCSIKDHKTHKTVTVEEESEERKVRDA